MSTSVGAWSPRVSVSTIVYKCWCMVSVSLYCSQLLVHGLKESVCAVVYKHWRMVSVSPFVSQVLVHGLNKYVFVQLSTSIGAWSP